MTTSRSYWTLILVTIVAGACAQPPADGPTAVTPVGQPFMRPPLPIGPPAPVPDALAILRPTEAEREQVNEVLTRFIEHDRSRARPLLKKFESLLLLESPRPNIAATFTPSIHRMGRHDAFVAIARRGNIDLLLHGDSMLDWWQLASNRPVFDRYFGHLRSANFAVAGDTTQSVLWGLRHGEGQGFQPKAIMILIGTNNIGTFTPPEVAEGIGAAVMELRRNFPAAKILVLGLFPYGAPGDSVRDRIADVNRMISRLHDREHVFYMDIGDRFLDSNGVLLPGVFLPDDLHPSTRGYEIWGEAVSATLAELMR